MVSCSKYKGRIAFLNGVRGWRETTAGNHLAGLVTSLLKTHTIIRHLDVYLHRRLPGTSQKKDLWRPHRGTDDSFCMEGVFVGWVAAKNCIFKMVRYCKFLPRSDEKVACTLYTLL